MKVSVSLPPVDVEFLDDYAHRGGGSSRSAALQHAIELLRRDDLEDAYAAAWSVGDDGTTAWDEAVADGLTDAPR